MLIDGGLLAEDFATRQDDDAEHGARWWQTEVRRYAAIGKRMLLIGLDLGHINIKQRLDHDSEAQLPLWSNLVNYYFYYVTIKTIAVLYHQYAFDYHHYYLARFDQMAELCQGKDETRPSVDDLDTLRRRLVHNYESARNASKVLGAPYMHANYGLPIFYLVVLMICTLTYLMPQFYKEFDTSELGYLIQTPDEVQRPIDALIRDRVNSFITSSRLHSRGLMEHGASKEPKLFCSKANKQVYYRRKSSKPATAGSDDVRSYARTQRQRILWDHQFLAESAKIMAFEGMLQPYSKRRGWRDVQAIYYVIYIFLAPSIFLAWLAWAMGMPVILQIKIETDFMDWLHRVELFLYSSIAVSISFIYNMFVLAMCIDQAHTSRKLCHLVDTCIKDNAHRLLNHCTLPSLDEPATASRSSPRDTSRMAAAHRASTYHTIVQINEQTYDRIADRNNLSLLHLLLHYKIFVKGLRMQFRLMALWAAFGLAVGFGPAVIFRLLSVYLSRRDRLVIVLTLSIVSMLNNIGPIVVCKLNKRCLVVHTRLQSLMAHVVEMDQMAKAIWNRGCYNEHLVQLLRRELSHPEGLTDRFSAKVPVVQLNITLGNLLKFNFWYGLWAASSLVIDFSQPNARDIFGGVWRFYSSADQDLNRFFYGCNR